MNNNVDIDFLRFLSRERFDMTLVDALSLMNEARRLYAQPPREGAVWRGLYFSPEADDALRGNNIVTAIKEVRKDNHAHGPTGYTYNYNVSGNLCLQDARDVCDARRKFLRGW